MGGAIAVPYKETIAEWLNGRIIKEAKRIGAVNCLYRNENGELSGTNTDGEAAIKTFQEIYGSVKGKSVIILGCGGAGKAVAAYFSEAVADSGTVTIISRKESNQEYKQKIGSQWMNWSSIDEELKKCDVLINCTSIGFGEQENRSPLSDNQIARLKPNTVVFDVIYQPLETYLLKLSKKHNHHVVNGLAMNLEQAILAFQYNKKIDIQVVRKVMEGAK